MNLVKFNSFRPVVRRSFENDQFEHLFNDFFNADNGFSTKKGVPPANFVDLEKEFKIELAAPGLEKSDFKINIEKSVLTVEANVEKDEDEKTDTYTRSEFNYNSFSRSFRLGKMLDVDNVAASYENGILRIAIAKKEEALEKPAKEILIS